MSDRKYLTLKRIHNWLFEYKSMTKSKERPNDKAAKITFGIDDILEVIRKLSGQNLQAPFQKVPTKELEKLQSVITKIESRLGEQPEHGIVAVLHLLKHYVATSEEILRPVPPKRYFSSSEVYLTPSEIEALMRNQENEQWEQAKSKKQSNGTPATKNANNNGGSKDYLSPEEIEALLRNPESDGESSQPKSKKQSNQTKNNQSINNGGSKDYLSAEEIEELLRQQESEDAGAKNSSAKKRNKKK